MIKIETIFKIDNEYVVFWINRMNIKNEKSHLPFESRVKSNKIFTLNKNLIIKRLARLNINKSKVIINSLNLFIKIDE